MQTNQTPFQYIQRRGRQRKNNILSSIEKTDLRRRSISYNLKSKNSINDENAQQDESNDAKEHLNHIAFNNSIKKSYYYRKLLNKSIDSHLTTDEFQRVKEKFDKINTRDVPNDNKTSLFREIWQQEHFKKYPVNTNKDQQNYLEIIAKNSQKYKTLSLQAETHVKKKEETPKSILDIAAQRRTTLNFQLQILGNKKSIRIKDNHPRLKINTLNNVKTSSEEEKEAKEDKDTRVHPGGDQTANSIIKIQYKQQDQPSKTTCTFFKRFQQENSSPANQKGNQFLQITKLGKTILPVNNTSEIENIRLKRLILREYHSQKEQPQIFKRQIHSSWRPATRSGKVEATPFERRTAVEKSKRNPAPHFTNDIKGWMVKQENDDELIQNFQK